jgi:hypothetical protein
MPASTLSRRSVALLRVNLGQLHFGRPINFTRKLHKNLISLEVTESGAGRLSFAEQLNTKANKQETNNGRERIIQ